MKIHIKGGRVIDPGHGVDRVQDVYIAAGKIVSLGEAPRTQRRRSRLLLGWPDFAIT